MRIALLYDNKCNFVNELINYDLTFLIYDDVYVSELTKYNKPIKSIRYDNDFYDVLIATTNKVDNIRASKKIVVGDNGKEKKRVVYLDTFDAKEMFKEKEKHNHKFSIIIPNYNNAEWISKTIQSVLDQTYTNWEIYVIDDMSTDNSVEVAEHTYSRWLIKNLSGFDKINSLEFEKKFKVIKNEIKLYNGGSRNVGILEAKKSNADGYLLFIDSDDWLANEKVLERLNSFIDDEDLITLDYQNYIDYDTKRKYRHTYKNIDDLFMTNGSMCAVWCKCFKVSIAPLFEFNTLMEDRNYHYRLINRINTYANFGEITHTWNKMNTKSITTDKKQKYESDLQAKLEWDNCAYRHIAGMLDILNEISNPKWQKFIKDKINACKNKIANGIYEQF